MNNVENLFRKHYSRMYGIARYMLGNEEEARDAVSDVFVHLLTMPQRDVNEAYLLTSVRNRCLNIISHWEIKRRNAALLALAGDMEDDNSASGKYQKEQRLADIEEYISQHLSPQAQQIVNMRYVEAKGPSRISSELDISRNAVQKHLRNAINKLRQKFNP